jgi:hypothetical protein
MMKLTGTERLLLSNQFRILAKVEPAEAGHYMENVKILENGYTREYSLLIDDFSEEMSANACELVDDILDMHRALKDAYEELQDKSGIRAADIKFHGFDGNNEIEYLRYASFLFNQGRWEESKGANGECANSHARTLDRYRDMLAQWKTSADRHKLTCEDIVRIVNT